MDAHVEPQLAPSRALAEFAANLRYDDIPPRVRELAKLLILDALGCGLAATGYDFAKATLAGAQCAGRRRAVHGDRQRGAPPVARCRAGERRAAAWAGFRRQQFPRHPASDGRLSASRTRRRTDARRQRARHADRLCRRHGGGDPHRCRGARHLPSHRLPRHRPGRAFQFSGRRRQAAGAGCGRTDPRAGHHRQHVGRGAGVPRGGRLDETSASGLGRGRRHHCGEPGAAWLLRPDTSL